MVALLNWLWHGVVVVAVVAGVLAAVGRRASAATRYRMWWAAVGVIVLLPLVTAIDWQPASASGAIGRDVAMPPISDDRSSWVTWGGRPVAVATPSTGFSLTVLVGLAAVVLVRLARVMLALRWRRGVRGAAQPLGAALGAALQPTVAPLQRGRRPLLVRSRHVRVAAVIGGRRPFIALSPEALAGVTLDDLRRVVLHERAHVDRRDDQWVVVQNVIMALIGWHPAMAWVDRHLTVERECACDDRVVEQTGDAVGYAACLLRLAELDVSRGAPPLALGVSRGRGGVVSRIERLLTDVPAEGMSGRSGLGAGRRVLTLAGATLLAALALVMGRPFVAMPPQQSIIGAERITRARPVSPPATSAVAPVARTRERESPGRVASPDAAVEDSSMPAKSLIPETTAPRAIARARRDVAGAGAPPEVSRAADEPGAGAHLSAAQFTQRGTDQTQSTPVSAAADRLAGAPASGRAPHLAGAQAPLEFLAPRARAARLSTLNTARGATGEPSVGTSEPPAATHGLSVETERPRPWWGGVADAGVVAGDGAAQAARSTAGAFTRVGLSIGGAFRRLARGADGEPRQVSWSTPGAVSYERPVETVFGRADLQPALGNPR